TLATESKGSPVDLGESITFPGASAHLVLLVSGIQTTVAIRLRFSESPCTTTIGRRNPGPEPVGSGRSAHQTSPWEITTRSAPGCVETPQKRTDRVPCRSRRRRDSSPRLPGLARDERYTRPGHY